MRGKNILWLSLITMLLSIMMVNVGLTAPKPPPLPEIYMDPTGRIPESPNELGHPGELYPMSVYVKDVVDLWAVQFTVEFMPLLSVLTPQDFVEGTFLADGWTDPPAADTFFFCTVDGLNGKATVIVSRTGTHDGDRWGATGGGLLATFNFLVLESGETPIKLSGCIMLDSNLSIIPCTCSSEEAYYYGTTGYLVMINLPEGHKITAGTTFPICCKVRNDGDIPIYAKVRFYITRAEVPRQIEIYSGQTYGGGGIGEPLPFVWVKADEYVGGYESGDWTNPGALVGDPDGFYSESVKAGSTTGYYGFEDLDLAGRVILNMDLRGWTCQPSGGTSNDFDPYIDAFDAEGGYHGWAWCDSMGGTAYWAWTGGRYYEGSAYDMPEYYMGLTCPPEWFHTEEGFNNMLMEVENYGIDGQVMQIDALKWKVTFASITPVEPPTYLVPPGGTLNLDCVTWPSTTDHIGSYDVTATIEYSSELFSWNSMGSPQKTAHFWIVEP